jgi:hypothetical protein
MAAAGGRLAGFRAWILGPRYDGGPAVGPGGRGFRWPGRRGSYYGTASAVTMRTTAVGVIARQVRSAEPNWSEFGSMPVAGAMAVTPLADGSGKFSMPCERMQAA